MTAPWTPRERALREALEKIKQECLHPLECKVLDPEDGRHAVIWAIEAATPGEWKPEVPAWNKHRRNCKTAVSSPTGTVLNTVTPKVPRGGGVNGR